MLDDGARTTARLTLGRVRVALFVLALVAGGGALAAEFARAQTGEVRGTARVSGTLTDVSGRAQPGAVVRYRHAAGVAEGEVAADAQGRFTLDRLAEGLYTIEARGRGRARRHHRASPRSG